MKYAAFVIIVLLCLFGTVVFAETISPAERLEKINKAYREQVDGEIQRRHEIQLEEKRIEVLARLYDIGSDTYEIHANAYSSGATVSNTNTVDTSATGGNSDAVGTLTNNPSTGAGNDTVTINN